jgi:SOS-response transcriptional repressor LexA
MAESIGDFDIDNNLIDALVWASMGASSTAEARKRVAAVLFPRNEDDAVMDLIRAHVRERGDGPSLQFIADARGRSKNWAYQAVQRLMKRGLIRQTPGVYRSIEIVR